uniref:Uncharacterized protein n=1 Tax=Meloidogyne enterolobii TaxID=390850 RepID=A0A6V7UYH5_MELEN|nr:unnamed protein product [Meloidogyne enterolobii]
MKEGCLSKRVFVYSFVLCIHLFNNSLDCPLSRLINLSIDQLNELKFISLLEQSLLYNKIKNKLNVDHMFSILWGINTCGDIQACRQIVQIN